MGSQLRTNLNILFSTSPVRISKFCDGIQIFSSVLAAAEFFWFSMVEGIKGQAL